MNCIFTKFKEFDLFGEAIQFKFQGKKKNTTLLGNLASLTILIIVLSTFIEMMIDMVSRKYPIIVQNEVYNSNPEPFQIDPKSFILALGIADSSGLPITILEWYKYFQFYSYYCRQIPTTQKMEKQCIYYQIDKCKKLNFESKKFDFSEKDTEYLFCLNQTEFSIKPPILQGIASSNNFSYFGIMIQRCKNTSYSSNCAPANEIDQILNDGYIAIVLTTNILNQQQQGNPYILMKKNFVSKYSARKQTYVEVKLFHSIIHTSQNFFYFFPDHKTHNSLEFSDVSQIINDNQDSFYQANIFLEEKQKIYYRKYTNILDIIGKIGGLLDGLLFIFSILIKPFQEFSLDVDLVLLIEQIQNSNQQNAPKTMFLKKFLLFFCGFNKKSQELKKTVKGIQSLKDYTLLINLMKQVELLKHFLFTQEQFQIFNDAFPDNYSQILNNYCEKYLEEFKKKHKNEFPPCINIPENNHFDSIIILLNI